MTRCVLHSFCILHSSFCIEDARSEPEAERSVIRPPAEIDLRACKRVVEFAVGTLIADVEAGAERTASTTNTTEYDRAHIGASVHERVPEDGVAVVEVDEVPGLAVAPGDDRESASEVRLKSIVLPERK